MAEAVETIEIDPKDVPGEQGRQARGEPVTPQDISTLVGPRPDPTMDIGSVATDLGNITRQEIKDRGELLSGIFGRAHEDQDRARKALDAEGVGPHELQPWDAEQERRKYQYDPVEAFGSFGSVFATIASAFTRRPMINALNASAAAMEATRAAKKEDFQNAYHAWKDNNELVIKRHTMMHQQYQDAISLMDTDLRLGTAKLSALAAQYGDQKTLALLEHGMSKELFEMLDARTRAVDHIQDTSEKMAARLRKDFDLNQRLQQPGITKQDIPRILREWHEDWATNGLNTPERDAYRQFVRENPKASAEQRAEYIQKMRARTSEQEAYRLFVQQWKEAHNGEDPPADEVKKFLTGLGKGGGARGQMNDDDIKTLVEGMKSGTTPPNLTGLYGANRGRIEAEAKRQGFDLAKAQLDFKRAERQIASLNSTQMTRFTGAATAVINTIDRTKETAEKLKLSGISPLNHARLTWLVKYRGNTEQGQLAAKYLTDVNAVKEEFANVATGGYAPTESVWQLANQQINADYGVDELSTTLEEVKKILNYRLYAIPGMSSIGPGAPNPFLPSVNTTLPPKESPVAASPPAATTSKDGWSIELGR